MPTDAPDAPDAPRRRPVIAAVATALVVLLVVAAWQLVAARTVGDVSAPESGMVCTGTTATVDRLVARPGMRCSVVVGIANDSSHAVHVDAIRDPFAGSSSGLVRRVAFGHESRRTAIDQVTARQAGPQRRIVVDEVLPAGASRRYVLVYVFQPTSCFQVGTGQTATYPTAEVHFLGRTRDVTPDGGLTITSAKRGTCD